MKLIEAYLLARGRLNNWHSTLLSAQKMQASDLTASMLISQYARNWAEFADAHPQQAEEFLAVRAVTLELSSKIDRTPI